MSDPGPPGSASHGAEFPDLEALPADVRDRVRLERVYRGDDAPQATLRAIFWEG